jgi:hypothetical protein
MHTSDGKHLDVNHPEMAWLTRMALLVARPVADPRQDIPERYDSVSPLHIVPTSRSFPPDVERSTRNCHQIRLASAQLLPTTSLRLAIINTSHSLRSIAAGTKPGALAIPSWRTPEIAIRKKYGQMVHSHFAG